MDVLDHAFDAFLRWPVVESAAFSRRTPIPDFAGRRHSRGPIVEAKKWIAVTGKPEFVNDWEKTP
jgi:hypothetical protein